MGWQYQTGCFAQASFCPIARDGIPDLLGAGKANPNATCGFIRMAFAALDHHRRCCLPFCTGRAQKIGAFGQDRETNGNRRGHVPCGNAACYGGLRRCHAIWSGGAVTRSATCGPARGVRSGSCGQLWSPYVREIHGAVCAQGSRVERCVSSLRLQFAVPGAQSRARKVYSKPVL